MRGIWCCYPKIEIMEAFPKTALNFRVPHPQKLLYLDNPLIWLLIEEYQILLTIVLVGTLGV